MKLFVDTALIEEITEVNRWGILDGVTTNPTHVSKTGKSAQKVYEEILRTVKGPVSLETIAEDAEGIVREARELAAKADNVVVKVPITCDGLTAVKQLNSEGIKTNVTVVFSPLQALLAAKCGATYVSPFIGRLDAIGHTGMEIVQQIKAIYDNYDYSTEIIVASIRHPLHVLEAALIGADICTMGFATMKQLYDHPLTDLGIERFLNDWKKVPKE
ncbi:MAG: fructose-6-phosphate aldolase [Pirellulales bacterium]|nr:fructose-6-phosphate aldolase [Pirellulales bacterium]